MIDMRNLPKISKEYILVVGVGIVLGVFVASLFLTFIVFATTDIQRCKRAIPHEVITGARSFPAIHEILQNEAIMCKSVVVGAATETITWLDKNGARLDR